MALTIGRAGLTLALPDPSNWATQNGIVTLIGKFQISPVTDAMRLRDQLLGYQDNFDEPVVPLSCDAEPRLTGYYAVLGVSITTDLTAMAVGYVEYSLTLQPVQGYTQPWLESVINGALLTNAVGAVAGDVNWFHAVPVAVSEYSDSQNPANNSNRSNADGAAGMTFYWDAGTAGISSIARFGLSPANYYFGACKFEQGSSLQPVAGRAFVQADTLNWRLSNGMVRVTVDAAAKLFFSFWNPASGGSWSTPKAYQLGAFPAGFLAMTSVNSVMVLRNSPESCVIRLSMTGSFAGFISATITLDISVRRGDMMARMFLSSTSSQKWRLQLFTAEASSAITYSGVTTGGITATGNDADGNRFVMLSYQAATTSDLVNGRLSLNSAATTADFAVAMVIGGAGGAPNRASDLARQYLAAQSETQRIVAR